MFQQALKVAYEAHKGQTRDGGDIPYIVHPFRVSMNMYGEFAQTTALLHDVVEDTKITLEDLKNIFPKKVTEAVDALSRRKDEKYFDYVNRLSKNEIAVDVKIADVIDNISDVGKKDTMIKRYNKTLEILINL